MRSIESFVEMIRGLAALSVPDATMNSLDDPIRCHACAAEAGKLYRCSRCFEASFCSKACQTASWPAHRLTCRKVDQKVAEMQARWAAKQGACSPEDDDDVEEDMEEGEGRPAAGLQTLPPLSQEAARKALKMASHNVRMNDHDNPTKNTYLFRLIPPCCLIAY
jgi:hypothetical protein